jgi:hypothetical protein
LPPALDLEAHVYQKISITLGTLRCLRLGSGLWDPKRFRKKAPKKRRKGEREKYHFLHAACFWIGLEEAGVAAQLWSGKQKALIGASA